LCSALPIRTERRQNPGELVQTLYADLRLPQRHAGAIALIEHPVRQLAAKVRSFVRVYARQILPAAKPRHLQASSE
jgi:hypothetical protein